MAIRMLVDSTHPEETRVAIVRGNRVEDFDFEAAAKKQLKGNIYLAKVTRVEPSLQAAFVDYGGNRHGFLAFSEIHPDYYQIPVEDREALLAEEAEIAASQRHHDHDHDHDDDGHADHAEDENGNGENHEVEAIVSHHDDLSDEIPQRSKIMKRRYKIQEVIKRRQVLLIQVVKEERGNKGAALTTYLSLAGRYCVLMPNTLHGGGVSRKIANPADRRKLKSILADLNMPDGMACIIRTAGLSRTKAEIKRDFDYLERTWDDIRALTLESIAPALIYEEGDLIKRAIRDHYNKEIDEILVEGEEGYKSAKSFMKLLMPSHSKKIKHYKDRVPLFQRFQVEAQLDSMYNPVVQLRSGGYIVINPTEALVSIDVNSGKSTREHNIEETALRTNLEASEEVARQLRLRDMAGLIVIDFIDMEDRNNGRNVERRLKDCLKADRARIQVGKISPFGLMEMSRQRLRPGILEASTHTCPQCEGTGIVRSVESSALHALRSLEDEGIRGRSAVVHMYLAGPVALYVLNHKRQQIAEIEARYGFQVFIEVDNTLMAPKFRFERENIAREQLIEISLDEPLFIASEDDGEDEEEIEDEIDLETAEETEAAEEEEESDLAASEDREDREDGEEQEERGSGDDRRKRRRRRRRRGRNGAEPGAEGEERRPRAEATEATAQGETEGEVSEEEGAEQGEFETQDGEAGDQPRRRRRRGRRGGRRRGRPGAEGGEEFAEGEEGNAEAAAPVAGEPVTAVLAETVPAIAAPVAEAVIAEVSEAAVDAGVDAAVEAAEPATKPKRVRAPRRKKEAVAEEAIAETVTAEAAPEAAAEKPKKPARRRTTKAKTAEVEAKAEVEAVVAPAAQAPEAPVVTAEKPAQAPVVAAEKPAQSPVVAVEKPAPAPEPAAKAEPAAAAAPQLETATAAAPQTAASRHLASAPVEVKDVGEASGEKSKKGWWSRTFGN